MASTVRVFIAFLFVAFAAGMLGGCNDDGKSVVGASTDSVAAPDSASNTAPTISGTPASSVTVGAAYSFHPKTTEGSRATLTFTIKNQPAWATFAPTTGTLSGVPTAANVGSYPQILITVSDGVADATLAAFSITVTSAPAAAASNTGLAISGSPALSVVAGAAYSFRPTVTGPTGTALSYTVKNLPAWATFSATTGAISGTPTAANVGSSGQIVITVNDGTATAALAAFSISVTQPAGGVATLSWTVPTANTQNTTVELAGYRIYYGTSANELTHIVDITSAGSTSYVINNLSTGTWYFAITAYDTANVESILSKVVAATI